MTEKPVGYFSHSRPPEQAALTELSDFLEHWEALAASLAMVWRDVDTPAEAGSPNPLHQHALWWRLSQQDAHAMRDTLETLVRRIERDGE
jgi:hypothetical protein